MSDDSGQELDPIDREVEELARERDLILEFLGGRFARIGREKKKPKGQKDRPKGQKGRPIVWGEDRARMLLAKQLRSNSVSDVIRWRLAALIEPDLLGRRSYRGPDGSSRMRPTSQWMVVIEPRHPGKKLSHQRRDQNIAHWVARWKAAGKQVKWALGEVSKQYDVGEETVRQAWHKYGVEAEAVLNGRVIQWEEYLESTTRDFDL
jgi:hypothetical protein